MSVREPLRVRLTDERHATELARQLTGLDDTSVQADGPGWEVVVACTVTDSVIVRVLDSLRRTLAGQPTATALVLLDGCEYHFEAE